jgi:hypothetical protein
MLSALILTLLLASPLAAQEPQPPKPPEPPAPPAAPAPPRPDRAPTPLTVQVTLTRLKDDKVTSRIPYTLAVNADDRRPTRVRVGIETPVPTTTFQPTSVASEGGAPAPPAPPMRSFQYRPVGVNIDARAESLADGQYRINLTVEQSSVARVERDPTVAIHGMPLYGSFHAEVGVVLRDGQTAETVSATDPVTGETLKIDVTLTRRK